MKKYEFGLIRDGQGKIVFDFPRIIRDCNQGCTIYILGYFYLTILRNGCISK